MTPVHCITKHDPPNSYGDCVRACIASLFDLPCAEVPHFFEDGPIADIADARLREWLAARGYAPFYSHFDGSISRADLLDMMRESNPGIHYLLFGSTSDGDSNHVVICKDNEVVHDPAWVVSGLSHPGSNGFWSIMVVARA
jgi:hypothetical protein